MLESLKKQFQPGTNRYVSVGMVVVAALLPLIAQFFASLLNHQSALVNDYSTAYSIFPWLLMWESVLAYILFFFGAMLLVLSIYLKRERVFALALLVISVLYSVVLFWSLLRASGGGA